MNEELQKPTEESAQSETSEHQTEIRSRNPTKTERELNMSSPEQAEDSEMESSGNPKISATSGESSSKLAGEGISRNPTKTEREL